jgi:hypothetical protein
MASKMNIAMNIIIPISIIVFRSFRYQLQQHFLNFLPDPQLQGSFRFCVVPRLIGCRMNDNNPSLATLANPFLMQYW